MQYSISAIQELENRYRANFINTLPGFKCLQLVGTIGESGHSNLGLFNSIFHLGASPALLGMIFRPQSEDHDTLKNIIRSESFTFNTVAESFYQNAHQTSARYITGCSEFVECGLTEYFIADFDAPFVAESPIKIALSLQEIIPINVNQTTMVIGKIERVLLSEDLIEPDGNVNHQKAGTITVAGLDSYYSANLIAQLNYAKPNVPTSIKTNF